MSDKPGVCMAYDDHGNARFEEVKAAIKELAAMHPNRAQGGRLEAAAIAALVSLVDHYEGALQGSFNKTTKLERAARVASPLISAVERANRHGNLPMDVEDAFDEYERECSALAASSATPEGGRT